jgi:hypothetical protein
MRTAATQQQLVMKHLKRRKKITSMEAFEYGITRLSAIVFDLRGEGVPVITTPTTSTNQRGVTSHYATYSLPADFDWAKWDKSKLKGGD